VQKCQRRTALCHRQREEEGLNVTCIVGLVDGDTIYMGGDTLGADMVGTHVVGRADEKVFTSNDFIMGFCGSYRVGQLLRYSFVPPDPPSRKDDMAYMVTDFVDAWRAIQKEKGSLKKLDEEETHPATVLVGWRGNLYAIEEDFDVGRPQDSYYAIGAGAHFAFGSLHSTKGLVQDPKQRVIMALEAATAYNAACRGPYTMLNLMTGKNE
jgi:ATP-dependent protease HslVU (ClpYQ) peptidase subunit